MARPHQVPSLPAHLTQATSGAVQTQPDPEQPLRRETFDLAAPAGGAVVRRAAVLGDRLALLWNSGALTACRLSAHCRRPLTAPFALGPDAVSLQLKGFAISSADVRPPPS